jgi:hypothetical protein
MSAAADRHEDAAHRGPPAGTAGGKARVDDRIAGPGEPRGLRGRRRAHAAVDDEVGADAREARIVNGGHRNAAAPGGRHPPARRRGGRVVDDQHLRPFAVEQTRAAVEQPQAQRGAGAARGRSAADRDARHDAEGARDGAAPDEMAETQAGAGRNAKDDRHVSDNRHQRVRPGIARRSTSTTAQASSSVMPPPNGSDTIWSETRSASGNMPRVSR